ncbi:MAG TPA: hypothetical protein VFQ53_42275 [Kofleriaceae bacterium]|nr:hypothetical protein [Kofleriaceae bacterium]
MKHLLSIVAWLLVVTSGCVVDEDGDALDDTMSEVLSNNRLSANRLSANRLSANKLSAVSLSGSALGTSELVKTADGREVLAYIVSCALPARTSVTVKYGGASYMFPGSIGLAPGWATRAPTVSERRWVTACLLARTNLYGVTVELSLRGPHPALAAGLTETLGYTLVEGAFYGDLFDPAGPTWFACSAELRDLDLALSTQELRACAVSTNGTTTQCGFTYTGKCTISDLGLAPACATITVPYASCLAGRTASAPRYGEVITVALKTGL